MFQIYEISMLVEHKNIKLASSALKIDESTFRRHISQIEEVLKTKLYNVTGNKLEITSTAKSIHGSQLKNINRYINEYNKSTNKIKTNENTIKILCQSDYLKVLTHFVSKTEIDAKLNLELISENEFFRLNPSQLLNHYLKFDCILMHEPHQLKMSHQWKMQSFPAISYFFYHKKYSDIFSNVTLDNIETFNILNARLFLDRTIQVSETKDPKEARQISVHSHVQSDSIRSNIVLAGKDKFIVHLPSFIPSLYEDIPLIQIPNLYLNYLELNLYYKAELSQEKQTVISKFRSFLNQLIVYEQPGA